MSFYGNLSNNARFLLYFDKIYKNRVEMENNKTDDGVFIGRYVLIEYGEDNPKDNYLLISAVKKGSKSNLYYGFMSKDISSNATKLLFRDDADKSLEDLRSIATKKKLAYTCLDDDADPDLIESSKNDYLVAYNAYVAHMNDTLSVSKGLIVYLIDYSTNQDKFYTCTSLDDLGYAIFTLTTGPISNQYLLNYNIDSNVYNGASYDSTVWRKVCEDGEIKYTMIAELNTKVPLVDLVVDAPTLNPIPPHFGSNSSNTEYKLHVLPTWGFRVKGAEANLKESDGLECPSDETAIWTSSKYYEDDGIIKTIIDTIDGAIYYNKAGFNIEKSIYSDINNSISIAPTGKSGTLYNIHSGEMDNENIDIYEMSIILPAIGNAIAKVYDTLYGVNEENSVRYRDIEWKDVLNNERKIGNSSLGYATRNLETVAGCINSVHDLMGMIIHETEDDLTAEGTITDADMDKIYYQDGKYYRKHETYNYEEVEYNYEPIELNINSYAPFCYYYLAEGNYLPAVDIDFDKNKSYFVKEFKGSFDPIELKDYEPNKFYYRDSHNNYILDSSLMATNERYYCTFTATSTDVLPYNGDLYFIKKYSDDGTFIGYTRNTESYNADLEYFSIDDSNSTTTKFYLGSVYSFINESGEAQRDVSDTITEGRVYYSEITPPTGQDWDSEGNYKDIFDVVEESLIDLIGFEEDKYYIKTDDDNYVLLKSLDGYSPEDDTTYYILNIEKFEGIFFERETFWYLQEGSYYLDNNEALDESENREYYIISDVVEITTPFFVSGAYYYYNEYGELVIEDGSSQSSDKQYYDKINYYVIGDALGNYAYGSVWNEQVNLIPASVSIGARTSRYEMQELTGFADSLNTIHGLILQINTLLDANDNLTRDTSSVQGTINKMNDILNSFATIAPGKFLITDMYNRINSVKPNTDTWLQLDIKPYANKPEVLLSHLPANTNDLTSTQEGDESPDFGATFLIPEVKYDVNGHIAEKGTHTVKIPKPSLTDAKANNADVITLLILKDTSGTFTTTRTNIGNLVLTGYEKLTEDIAIIPTDTLNTGLGKIEGKLDRAIEKINLLEENTYLNATTEYEFDNYSKLDLISIIKDMAARITKLEASIK